MGIEVIDVITDELLWSQYDIRTSKEATKAFREAAIVTERYDSVHQCYTPESDKLIVKIYVANLRRLTYAC